MRAPPQRPAWGRAQGRAWAGMGLSVRSDPAVSAHVALGSCARGSATQRRVRGVTIRPRGRRARLKTDLKASNCITNPSQPLCCYGILQGQARSCPVATAAQLSEGVRRPKLERGLLVLPAEPLPAHGARRNERPAGPAAKERHPMELSAWGQSTGATSR